MMTHRRGRRIAWAVVLAVGVAGGILFACVGHEVKSPPPTPLEGDGSLEADVAGGLDVASGLEEEGDADAGPTCSTSTPFTLINPLEKINTVGSEEFAPTLTADEKTIVFARADTPTIPQLLMATRASLSDDFGPPTTIAALANFCDGILTRDPQISLSGDDMIFNLACKGGVYQIFRMHRSSGVFEPPTPALPVFGAQTSRPFLTSDGAELFFSSNRDSNTGQFRIFRSLNSDGVFAVPAPVSELDDPLDPTNGFFNGYPTLSRDALTMYFASSRPYPFDATHRRRTYVTKRPTRDKPFDSNPTPVKLQAADAELVDEQPGWLSTDGCRLYFDSNRSGKGDIFVASKVPDSPPQGQP